MKKLLIGLVAIVILLGIGSVVFLGKLDGVIADAINKYGSEALGTSVSVSAVKTDLKEGSISISGLNVANPPGYTQSSAFNMGEFSTKVDYEKQEIAEIVLRNPSINAELKGTQSNFKDLLDGLPESAPSSETESDGEEITLTIQSLKLLSAKVNLTTDSIGNHSFVMADLVLKDITGTPSTIASSLTTKLTQHVNDQITKFAKKLVENKAVDKAKEVAKEKVQEKVNEKLGEQVGSKLKGLKFNFK
jgi:hypothetical protein